jgi:hypothetical protein
MEIDIADPASPQFTRRFDYFTTGVIRAWPTVGNVAVAGDRAWLVDYLTGLHLLDLSQPDAITENLRLETSGSASDIALVGDHVLVANGQLGLLVLERNTMQPVRQVDGLGAHRLKLIGDTAYVSGIMESAGQWRTFVWAVDVADPARPFLLGRHEVVHVDYGYAPYIGVVGEYAYVTSGGAGVQVLKLVEGDVLPTVTPGPTLTPVPGFGPHTPTPTRTPAPTMPTQPPKPTSTPAEPWPGHPATLYLPFAYRGAGSPSWTD